MTLTPSNAQVAGNSFGPNSLSLGLPKDSALLDTINHALLEVLCVIYTPCCGLKFWLQSAHLQSC